MRTKDYIDATVHMLRDGKDPTDVFSGLTEMLAQRKQESLYGKILKGIYARIARQTELETPRLIVAKNADTKTYQDEIREACVTLNLTSSPRLEIDDALIGGFILLGNGSRIDRSHKTHLLNLYQSLTR